MTLKVNLTVDNIIFQVFKIMDSDAFSFHINFVDDFASKYLCDPTFCETMCTLISQAYGGIKIGSLSVCRSKLRSDESYLENIYKRKLEAVSFKSNKVPRISEQRRKSVANYERNQIDRPGLISSGNDFQPVPGSCGKVAVSSYSELVEPLRIQPLVLLVQSMSSKEKQFQCSFCSYRSANGANVKRHLEMKHVPSSQVFQCQSCPNTRTFKLKNDLKRHYMKIHNISDAAAKVMVNS